MEVTCFSIKSSEAKNKWGEVVFNTSDIKFGMIKMGLSDGSFEQGLGRKSILNLHSDSKIIFYGKATFANHFMINNGGEIRFGDGFSSNYRLFITCDKLVQFGSKCMLGWNNTFIDNDGHKIINSDGEVSSSNPIIIGDNNWITSNTVFLKGSRIGDNSVIGFQTFLTRNFQENSNVLIVGNPGRIVKKSKVGKNNGFYFREKFLAFINKEG